MKKEIVEKFFSNQATTDQAKKVLEWFDTPEGLRYLQKRMDADSILMDRKELRNRVQELDSENLYYSIEQEIKKQKTAFSIKCMDGWGLALKAAAAVLVILTASYFAISHEKYSMEQIAKHQPIHIQTEDEQHREITLSDGSVVRMNSNSEIVISENFMHGKREIALMGEAYFDVAHNPEQPFIIHANQSKIRVIGTSFNIKSIPDQDNVQVAVTEGQVSFTSYKENTESEQLAFILSKNQFGYMDIKQRSILVDDMAVENYLAWKSGWFNFHELTMEQVCTQLDRIYNINCRFTDESIPNMHLTSRFSKESIDKTLEVIALSLELDYELNEHIVSWRVAL